VNIFLVWLGKTLPISLVLQLQYFSSLSHFKIVILFCICSSTETVARNIEGTEIVNKECVQRTCRIFEVLLFLCFNRCHLLCFDFCIRSEPEY